MPNRIRILLVEDNAADVDLTREGFATSRWPVELSVATNGIEACDYVHKRGSYSTATTPDLILLDLNLPGIDGKAVLREIKQDVALRQIPVTILSSSSAEKDVNQSYAMGANCYMVKPIDFRSFERVVRAIEEFWFDAARLPRREFEPCTGRNQA